MERAPDRLDTRGRGGWRRGRHRAALLALLRRTHDARPLPPALPGEAGGGGAGNAQGTGDVCDEILAWADANPEIVLEFPAVCPTLVASDPHMAWAVLLPFSDADPGAGCSLLAAYGRAGNECCEGYVDPAPPTPPTRGAASSSRSAPRVSSPRSRSSTAARRVPKGARGGRGGGSAAQSAPPRSLLAWGRRPPPCARSGS
ncbi:MAG: hypothetical protein M5T61_05710 [Acidimicrobiia bacterium]|nr:hypothetical protein [Acidimicrobiia bacterium]